MWLEWIAGKLDAVCGFIRKVRILVRKSAVLDILIMIIIYDGVRVGGWRNGLILWGNLGVGDGVGRKRNSSIVNYLN